MATRLTETQTEPASIAFMASTGNHQKNQVAIVSVCGEVWYNDMHIWRIAEWSISTVSTVTFLKTFQIRIKRVWGSIKSILGSIHKSLNISHFIEQPTNHRSVIWSYVNQLAMKPDEKRHIKGDQCRELIKLMLECIAIATC